MIIQIATSSILDVINNDQESTSLTSSAVLNKDSTPWNFEKRPGMMYVVVRAVSVGTNGNGDHFTEDELRRAYKTFVGKGVFVNHESNNIESKRGKIVDAQWVEDGPAEKYVKCVLEINAQAFPALAQMIRAGMADSVSMGCQVAYSNCSICGNKAKTVKDYCIHVRSHKSGVFNGRQVYEINHGIEFIEVSFVTTGADAQAKVLEIIAKQARLTNQDVRQLWVKASKDPSYVASLEDSQNKIGLIALESIKKANQLRGEK